MLYNFSFCKTENILKGILATTDITLRETIQYFVNMTKLTALLTLNVFLLDAKVLQS